jgi:hypothetical protein
MAAKARASQGVCGCLSTNHSVITSRFKLFAQALMRFVSKETMGNYPHALAVLETLA